MAHEPRLRDYLARDEVAALLRSPKKSPRHGARNRAMILLAYRHGLRASEVTGLRWSDFRPHRRDHLPHQVVGGVTVIAQSAPVARTRNRLTVRLRVAAIRRKRWSPAPTS
jgi:type 1 fimbriae regulatory protein FimB/type 1 fimbriae regulatory protein FimE